MDPQEQNNVGVSQPEAAPSLSRSDLSRLPLTQTQRTQPLGCGLFASGFTPSAEFEQIAANHLNAVRELGAVCIKPANRSSELSKPLSEIKSPNLKLAIYEVECLAGVLSQCPLLESTPLINAITGIYDRERHAIYLEKMVCTRIPAEQRVQMVKDLQALTQELPLATTSEKYLEPLWRRLWGKQEEHEILLRDEKPILPVQVSLSAQKAAIAPADIERSLINRVNQRDLAVCAIFSKLREILSNHNQKPSLVLESSLPTPLQYYPHKAELHVSPALFSLTGEEISVLFRFVKKLQLSQVDSIDTDQLANARSFAIEFSYDLLTGPSLRVVVAFVKDIQSALTKLDEKFIQNNPFLAQLFDSISLIASDPQFVQALPSIKSLRFTRVRKELMSHINTLEKSADRDETVIDELKEILKEISKPVFSKRVTKSSSSDYINLKNRVDVFIGGLQDKQFSISSRLHKTLLLASKMCTVNKFKPADNVTSAEKLFLTKKRYEIIVDRLADTAPEFWKSFSLEKGNYLAMLRPGLSDIANQSKKIEPFSIQGALANLSENPLQLLEVRSERMAIRADRYNHKNRLKFSPARFELDLIKLDPSDLTIPSNIDSIAPLLRGISLQLVGSDKPSPSTAHAAQLLAREWLEPCVSTLRSQHTSPGIRGRESLAVTTAYALLLDRPDLGDREFISRVNDEPQLLARIKAILLERLFENPLSSPPYNNCISPQAKNVVKIACNAWDSILLDLLDSGLIQLGHFSDNDRGHIDRSLMIFSQWQSKLRLGREIEKIEQLDLANDPKAQPDMGAYLTLVSAHLLPRTPKILAFCKIKLSTTGQRLMRTDLQEQDLTIESKSWRIVLQQILEQTRKEGSAKEERSAVRTVLSDVHRLNSVSRKIAAQMFSKYLEAGGNDFAPSLVSAWINLLSVEGKLKGGLITEQTALQRLEKAPPEYTASIAQQWINAPEKILRLLKSDLDRNTKTFLLKRCPSEFIERALEGMDTDQVRTYFEDFSLIEALRITKKTMDPSAHRAFSQREVYESSIRDLPAVIECLENEQELPNYFAVLGVPRNAPLAIITKSYRMLALVYYPDLFIHESEDARDNAKERTKKLAEAYEVLSEEELSKNYRKIIPNYTSYYPRSPWYLSLPKSSDL